MSEPGPSQTPRRRPLHERSDSQRNVNANAFMIRLVPYSPPRPGGENDGGSGGGAGSEPQSPLEQSANVTTYRSRGDDDDDDGSNGSSGGFGVGGVGLPKPRQRSHDASSNSTDSSGMTGRAKKELQHPFAISAGSATPSGPVGPGSALSSSSSLALSLGAPAGEDVSGNSGSLAHLPTSPISPTAPVVSSPAYDANISAVHASSTVSSIVHHPDRTLSSLSLPSLSPSLSPSPTPQPSQPLHLLQDDRHRHLSPSPRSPGLLEDVTAEPSNPSSAGTSPLLRPLSRRRNVVAVNPDNKTFTLVSSAERQRREREQRAQTASSSYSQEQPYRSQSQQSSHSPYGHYGHFQPHASSAVGVTEFGAIRTARPGSPPVSSTFSTLSTLSTATANLSLDHPSSDVFSEDRPSSPLTTIPDDRTASPASPKTPIQSFPYQRQHFHDQPYDSDTNTPTQQPQPQPAQRQEQVQDQQRALSRTGDPIASSPWNYRLVGGLRKVPRTPDLKSKGKQKSDEYQSIIPAEQEEEFDSPASFTTTRSPTTVDYDSPPPLPTLPPLREIDSPSASGSNLGAGARVSGKKDKEAGERQPGEEPQGGPESIAAPGASAARSIGAGLIFETDYSRRASGAPASASAPQPFYSLNPKPSFQSAASTLSERTNYKVYGQSSPAQRSDDDSLPELPSSSHSNYVLLGESSPAASSSNGSLPVAPSSDLDSNENYILHGDPSPSASIVSLNRALRQATSTDSLDVARGGARHKFSQESLVIQPLRIPKKKRSFDKFGYYRRRSRESLRSQPSLKSLSSIAPQEAARVFFTAPTVINVNLKGTAGPSFSAADPYKKKPKALLPAPSQSGAGGKPAGRELRDPSWARASLDSPPQSPKRVRMEAHPHVWSSQLSTVMSESEGGSEPPGSSRSPSALSGSAGPARSSGRRSSGFSFFGGASTRSRRLGSIGSSIAADDPSGSGSHSRHDSLEPPQPAYARSSPGHSPTVRDQDEHGDGLADLYELHNRPSRNGLATLFRNNSSDRNLHSSASSRTGSLNSASLPAWARLYYGSGERGRLLNMPSISSLAESAGRPDSRAQASPANDNLPLSIHSPRRRAREMVHEPAVAGPSRPTRIHQRAPSDTGSMDVAAGPSGYLAAPIRRKPSSVWSPHLRLDRYANRYSRWDPPSVQWSAESGPLGRRNAQVILFVTGFIIPINWIVAAFLPLPPDPKVLLQQEMMERGGSSSSLDLPAELEHTRNGASDETRYQSARWWRTLNRFMAILGILIIAAVIALVVIGVRQKW